MNIEALAKRAAAAVDADRVISLTRDLVRIRSVYEPHAPGSNEGAAAGFVAGVLENLGLTVHVEEVAPGRPNVVADWCGRGFRAGHSKTLMFEGHTDVVTEGDPESWTHPPFEARLIDGKIYGRGTADMKAGVAAALGALEAVMRTAPDLPGRVRMGFVVDEEGMMTGIKDFIKRGWAEGVNGAIICEPEEGELCLFQKGALRVGVLVQGRMAHGAMPYAGVNPIPPLADFVRAVRELEQKEQARLGEHEYLGLPWLTPTLLRAPAKGEGQLNVMPETAYLALDIRTVPGQNDDELFAALREIAERIEKEEGRVQVELERLETRPWTQTPADDPLVGALERAHETVFSAPPRYGGVPGATDGTFLRAWAGVPIVTVGPGDRTIPHRRDEFVRADEVVRAARLYAAAAVYFLSGEG